jgi:hypothetical protein
MNRHILSPIYKILTLEEGVSGSKFGLTSQLDKDILLLNEDIAFCLNLYEAPQYSDAFKTNFVKKKPLKGMLI